MAQLVRLIPCKKTNSLESNSVNLTKVWHGNLLAAWQECVSKVAETAMESVVDWASIYFSEHGRHSRTHVLETSSWR